MKEWLATFCLIVINPGFALNLFFFPIWNLRVVIHQNISSFHIHFWNPIWTYFGPAEEALTFRIAAVIVLCFVLVARKVLMTHQCFGYCRTVLAQHQDHLSNISSPCLHWGEWQSGLVGSWCPDKVSPPTESGFLCCLSLCESSQSL